MLQRHPARKLPEFLKHFDKNHLAKILFTSSSRPVGAHHFRDKRIETAHQFASRFIIMAQGSLNQLRSVEINHVVADSVSTLQRKTAVATSGLQPIFVVTTVVGARSRVNEVGEQLMKTNMKRNLLTFAIAGAIALGGFAWVNAQDSAGGFGGHQGGWRGHQFAMQHLTKSLNLTSDQQT